MAMAMGTVVSCRSAASSAAGGSGGGGGFRKGGSGRRQGRRGGGGVRCVASPSYSSVGVAGRLTDQYKTLRILPGASEKEVKKAFRQLALQYHPDVCKGGNCVVQFHRINEAYDMLMSSLRRSEEEEEVRSPEWCEEEEMRGMYDSSWDMWEEWMGWEGAGTLDYSSHINTYI